MREKKTLLQIKQSTLIPSFFVENQDLSLCLCVCMFLYLCSEENSMELVCNERTYTKPYIYGFELLTFKRGQNIFSLALE